MSEDSIEKAHGELFACSKCGQPIWGKPYELDVGVFCGTCMRVIADELKQENERMLHGNSKISVKPRTRKT